MNLVITGGAGFIGSEFAHMMSNKLSKSEFQKIIIVDKLTYAGSLSNIQELLGIDGVEFHKIDITNFQEMSDVIQEGDKVVNFAAESHVDNSIHNPESFMRTNIIGVGTLLEVAIKKKISKFVQVSTDEVYGSLKYDYASEDFPLAPSSPYSASKGAGDLLCLAFHKTYGLDVSITRAANNYGKNQYPEKLIPLFVFNLVNGKNVPLYGSGENTREWIHVTDHCRAIETVMTKGTPGSIYNVGSGVYKSNLEITKEMLRLLELSDERIDFVEDRLGHDFRYALNSIKIEDELGFTCSKDFDIEFKKTIEHYVVKQGR